MMGTKARSFTPLCNRSLEDLVPDEKHIDRLKELGAVEELDTSGDF